ncbi:MAG: cobyrinate a,c-diamide synthase [Deltaproteobacteria bacterium]|nr:cobyrinate a,c-diamide synthase [Deltaproteobacteria bacterium]
MPDKKPLPAIIIAGTNSGVGKTVITLGIMEALRKRGVLIQPFKAGPDYIDPGFHSALLKRPSYNLDTWMMGVDAVKKTFTDKMKGAGLGVIEGVMGLFDGKGFCEEGSTAHLAKVLNLPVLLVVDSSKASRSIGAVIKGFKEFDKKVNIKWVVFNRAGSPRHLESLKNSIPPKSGIKTLGYIPKDSSLSIPERHLGLMTQEDFKESGWKGFIKRASSVIEKHLDISPLLKDLRPSPPGRIKKARRRRPVKVAVALDNAFSFYYKENLEILEGFGAEIAFFSPLKDKGLPHGASGLYIGGGYPELHAKALEKNSRLRQEIKRLAEEGMPVFAECGGLMYLGKKTGDGSGRAFSGAGVFPWESKMLDKRAALGYREIMVGEGCPFIKKGSVLRGHEYHYSVISKTHSEIKKVFRIRQDKEDLPEGFLYKNSLATYIHIHFASNPAFAAGFVGLCGKFQERRGMKR